MIRLDDLGAVLVVLELDELLEQRPPVVLFAELIEATLHRALQERLDTADQILAAEGIAHPGILEEHPPHVEAPVVGHDAVEQLGAVDVVGLHDRRDEVVLRIVEHLDLVAHLGEHVRERPGGVHRPVGHVRAPVHDHLVGLFQGLAGLVLQTDDELRLGDDAVLLQELDGALVLLDRGLLDEAIEIELSRRLGAERDVHQTGLAVEGQQILVAHDVGHAGVDAPVDAQVAVDEFLAELDEHLLVDLGFFVGEDEEAHAVDFDQFLDLVDHALGIAHAVIAPELPLRAEATGEGTAARHVRGRDRHAERDVDVLLPLQDAPVRPDRIHVLDRRLGLGGDHLAVLAEEGDAAHGFALVRPAALVDAAHQIQGDGLALAAHDDIDPGRLAEHLLVHEGAVDAAEHGDGVRMLFLGDLQHALGGIDHRRHRGGGDDVGLGGTDRLAHLVVVELVHQTIDEMVILIATRLQIARDIGDPGRRPVAGDVGGAGAIVGVDKEDSHRQLRVVS